MLYCYLLLLILLIRVCIFVSIVKRGDNCEVSPQRSLKCVVFIKEHGAIGGDLLYYDSYHSFIWCSQHIEASIF